MSKIDVKALETRLSCAENRLRALELEKPIVEREITHLRGLIDVYKELPYDSVDEEKYITAEILGVRPENLSKSPKVHTGGKKKGESKYTEVFEAIFIGATEGLTNSQISKGYRELTGENVADGTIHSALYRCMSQGKVKRDRDKKYFWIGDKANEKKDVKGGLFAGVDNGKPQTNTSGV